MSWPTPQEYNEAIQAPTANFSDPELQKAKPELNALGLPRSMTGAFASVYRMHCEGRDLAVRCFLHNIKDMHERYEELSKYIMADDLSYTVTFEYLPEGIKVQDSWFPILKMEWVEGVALDQFLLRNVSSMVSMNSLLSRFTEMVGKLNHAGIAHGDLQHGNILMVGDELRLVDYDGMYVPGLDGYRSNELGHPNYQHPRRSPRHFGPFLDNFSAWVIYTSLLCINEDSDLFERLAGGDECILFRRNDLGMPSSSHVFDMLDRHPSSRIQTAVAILRRLIEFPVKQVPPLDTNIAHPDELPEIDKDAEPDELEEEVVASDRSSMRLSRLTNLPEWMTIGQTGSNRPVRTVGPWPQFRHYIDAVARCADAFHDPELRNGVPVQGDHRSGGNSIVFHIRSITRHLAVKCFFKHDARRLERYEELSKSIPASVRRYFVEFEYQAEGIKVGNYWYPILKMEWLHGMALPNLAEYYRDDKQYLESYLDKYRIMIQSLRDAGIAHGDLHPSNMLIVSGDFKLMDYDCLYVPAFKGQPSPELGQPNYQHPGRMSMHYGPDMDNFSAWIIDSLLLLMTIDYDLYDLVYKRLEYQEADSTWAFRFLDLHAHPDVRDRAKFLSKCRKGEFDEVPPLTGDVYPNMAKGGIFAGFKKLFKSKEPVKQIPAGRAGDVGEDGFGGNAGGASASSDGVARGPEDGDK